MRYCRRLTICRYRCRCHRPDGIARSKTWISYEATVFIRDAHALRLTPPSPLLLYGIRLIGCDVLFSIRRIVTYNISAIILLSICRALQEIFFSVNSRLLGGCCFYGSNRTTYAAQFIIICEGFKSATFRANLIVQLKLCFFYSHTLNWAKLEKKNICE